MSELLPDQIDRLNALLNWSWDPHSDNWEKAFKYLQDFVVREGQSVVGKYFVTDDGFKLGKWVAEQRSYKDKMELQRKVRLEGLSGWSWGRILDKQWEESFHHLLEFVEGERHARVPQSYRSIVGFRLGAWVSSQRLKIDRMSPEQKARLEALPGWVWDAITARWEEGFGYLCEFVRKEGTAKISQSYITSNGYKLGSWVSHQRVNKESLSPKRKERLESLPGWTWGKTKTSEVN